MALRGVSKEVAGRGWRLLALILLALALRAMRLSFQPLWWDEGYSVWFAHQPLVEMIRLTALDIHPPLYYALLAGWSRLPGFTPVPLRLFSVAVGVLAIPFIYLAGRWLAGPRSGLLAAFLLAINPFHVFYSQEVRMYALAMLWGTLAVGMAGHWLGLDGSKRQGTSGKGQAASGKAQGIGDRERGIGDRGQRLGWLAGYGVAAVLALYTLYYAGLVVAGIAVAGLWVLWHRRESRHRWILWLSAQAAVLILYLPWLLYAAPRLIPYVSQKVVADSDRPLGLMAYLARHLAAFNIGHVEGPLAGAWPLGLLGLLPLFWGLVQLVSDDADHRRGTAGRPAAAISFLLVVLGIALVLGWLLNLRFPFFPDRGERLLLAALPVWLLLIALSLSLGMAREGSRPQTASPLFMLLFVALAGFSLTTFYTTPRYVGEDYRPLIGQVTQWGRPEDTVFCVFPWQVGYFWSYGSPQGPQPVLSPSAQWGPEVAGTLDAALQRGHVWFPEHLALGGLLETAAEQYLAGKAYNLANRWYSPSTRLTGWASTSPVANQAANLAAPVRFGQGWQLVEADWRPTALLAANDALLIRLRWQANAGLSQRAVSLRLADQDGRTWAQRDYVPGPAAEAEDRFGLLVPAGTPPGQYELRLSVRPDPAGQPLEVLDETGRPLGNEALLGSVNVTVAWPPPAVETLAYQHPLAVDLEDKVRLVGFSATEDTLAPGEDLKVSLFWQARRGLATVTQTDLFAFVQLLDAQGRLAAAWEGPPVSWHPTSAWQPGELVRSQHTLRLPATLGDGRYRLIVGLFDPTTDQRLRVQGGLLRKERDYVDLARVMVVGREHVMEAPQPQVPLGVDLAYLGRLVGYDLTQTAVAPGQSLELTLYWQATETTGQRLKVFVHLVDEQGNRLGQSDAEPGAGAFPTSSWLPGEYLADRHRLTVREDAATGPATLLVGLYDPASGQRVPWLDVDGQAMDGALRLPTTIAIRD